MPKYVMERDIPNVGDVTREQVIVISSKSRAACIILVRNFNGCIAVTQDKIYCVYIAPDGEMVREHARQGWIPRQQGFCSKAGDRSYIGGSLT